MLYLKNATFINHETLEFTKTNIGVEYGVNGKIRLIDSLPDNLDKSSIIDCTEKLVTRSFACGHHHVYSALARGMNAPKKEPENFYETLKYIWWTLDKSLDLEMIEASALYTAMASAKSGVTFVIDHHASPFAVEGSLETLAKAFDRVGVSHLLCYETSERDGPEIAEKGLRETESYLQNRQGLVGLHASLTIGDATLKKAVELAEKHNSGIHIHVAEDLCDQDLCIKEHNKRVVERLYDFGVLSFPKSILGHCLHISEKEKKLLKESRAWIVQNCESNLKNNVGYFDSRGLGDNIIVGTDGMHSDMLRSAKAAFLVGQGFDCIGYDSAYKRFRKVHDYINTNKFDGDGDNNLVILDYDSPTEINQSNFFGHFIFGLESSHVQHVISSGKLIVKNRQILNVNEQEILEYSKKLGKKLWKKMSR